MALALSCKSQTGTHVVNCEVGEVANNRIFRATGQGLIVWFLLGSRSKQSQQAASSGSKQPTAALAGRF